MRLIRQRRTAARAARVRTAGLAAMAALATVITAVPASAAVQAAGQAARAMTATPTATRSAAAAPAPDFTPAPCARVPAGPQHARMARCYALVATGSDHQVKPADSPPAGALGPADIRSAYRLPAGGQGRTVAIVDAYGDSHAEADLAVFRARYGLPPCTVANGCLRVVNQDGQEGNYPYDAVSWALETSLDLDAVSSACPACHILLVEARTSLTSDTGAAVDTAVRLGARYVSNSYGVGGEYSYERSWDHWYTHRGVVVAAATGDSGDVQSWPAADPNVVAVGGTKLVRDTAVTRGWDESAWSDGGSGCSVYEPKPAYQRGRATGCPTRAEADISADADPGSGLAVYDTLFEPGWFQVGGTSLATPLVTAMYALAGRPAAGTYPVSYPYNPSRARFLNDITQGGNHACGTPVLCTAGRGWDGPTGLGTPDGVAALAAPGGYGTLAGTVLATSGAPLAGVTVSTADGDASTDKRGHYQMRVIAGRYTVRAAALGYSKGSRAGVLVKAGRTASAGFKLTALPSHTLSGTVTDGSGHGWPVPAKITVDGYPGVFYDNPFTGRYAIKLPDHVKLKLHVSTTTMPGYADSHLPVQLAGANAKLDIKLAADAATCTAPGYAYTPYTYQGVHETFTGWTGTAPQDGWTVTDNLGAGRVWRFDDPDNFFQPSQGDTSFALMSSDYYGLANAEDTELVSPAADLSGQKAPEVMFDASFSGDYYPHEITDVDLSTDGGSTWAGIWQQTVDTPVQGTVEVPIPQAAGKPDVRVRFRYRYDGGEPPATGLLGWGVDNVLIGTRTRDCAAVPAGVVAGVVRDGNTGLGVAGAVVSDAAQPSVAGTSSAAPGQPAGFYWLVAPQAGAFTVSDGRYLPQTANVDVTASGLVRRDWTVKSGRLTVTPASVKVGERLGTSASGTVTLRDTGSLPVHITLGQQQPGMRPVSRPAASTAAAPREVVRGPVSAGPVSAGPVSAAALRGGGVPGRNGPARSVSAATATGSGQQWTPIAGYPQPVVASAVAYDDADGKIYSLAGTTHFAGDTAGYTDSSYAYDPYANRWNPIAPAPQALISASAAYAGGKVYLAGGWNTGSELTSSVYAYNPARDSWSRAAYLPWGISAAGTAVLGGRVYVIGGCDSEDCSQTEPTVFRYDPRGNSWTEVADYPVATAYLGCAGIRAEIVCAGGLDPDSADGLTGFTSTYMYHPETNTWTKGADLPNDLWGMAASGTDGKLQISGGYSGLYGGVLNSAQEYDPATNAWTALPGLPVATYRGGGACGPYVIGGSGGLAGMPDSELLPGYSSCDTRGPGVSWLTSSTHTLTLQPGQSATVRLTASSAGLRQPGDYTASLAISTDTPYYVPGVAVTDHVTPPAAWGKINGRVLDAKTHKPLAGATVQLCTRYNRATGSCGPLSYSLTTDAFGRYQLWLDKKYGPLQVMAFTHGYVPATAAASIRAGAVSTVNFALRPLQPGHRHDDRLLRRPGDHHYRLGVG